MMQGGSVKNWIAHNPIKILLLTLLLAPWMLLGVYESSGICFSKAKIFSDKELIEYALQDKFDRGELKLGSNDISVDAYLTNHPDCCYVYRERGIFNLYGLLTGKRSVHVQYPLSEEAIKGGRGAGGSHFEQEIEMSSCGQMLRVENMGGFTPKPQKPDMAQ